MKKFQAFVGGDWGYYGNGWFNLGMHDSAEEAQSAVDAFLNEMGNCYCYYGDEVAEVEVAE